MMGVEAKTKTARLALFYYMSNVSLCRYCTLEMNKC